MKNRYDFFKYFNFIDIEIEELFSRCEGLKIASIERMSKCAFALMQIGLNKYDVYEVVLVNPSVLLKNPTSFADALSSLGKNAKDKIKSDPFIV